MVAPLADRLSGSHMHYLGHRALANRSSKLYRSFIPTILLSICYVFFRPWVTHVSFFLHPFRKNESVLGLEEKIMKTEVSGSLPLVLFIYLINKTHELYISALVIFLFYFSRLGSHGIKKTRSVALFVFILEFLLGLVLTRNKK